MISVLIRGFVRKPPGEFRVGSNVKKVSVIVVRHSHRRHDGTLREVMKHAPPEDFSHALRHFRHETRAFFLRRSGRGGGVGIDAEGARAHACSWVAGAKAQRSAGVAPHSRAAYSHIYFMLNLRVNWG